MADSSAAVEYFDWLCKQVKLYDFRELHHLSVATLPLLDSPHRVDIAFAIGRDSIVLINPIVEGRPTGGLDLGAWNHFVMIEGGFPISDADEARILACLLYRVSRETLTTFSCGAGDLLKTQSLGSEWIFEFNPARYGGPKTFKVGANGEVREL